MGRTNQTPRSSSGSRRRRRRPRLRFNFGTVLFIWFISFLSCFVLFMISANLFGTEHEQIPTDSAATQSTGTTTTSTQATESTTTTVTDAPETDALVNPVPESDKRSASYFNDCVFIGDSITQGLADYQLIPVKHVFAGIGMNLSKVMTEKIMTTYGNVTAVEAVQQAQPKKIYIMLGSNGIAWMEQADMIAQYTALLDALKAASPDSQIYILSIPPVTAERETAAEGPITNAAVDEYNSALLTLANAYGARYVDSNTALKGNDGKLPTEQASSDGIHFKKATYEIFIDYILTHTGE